MFLDKKGFNKEELKIIDSFLTLTKKKSENFFCGDEMIVINKQLNFLNDKSFKKSFNKYAKSDFYKSLAYRIYFLYIFASVALNIEGDFAECGVFRGFKSKVIFHLLKRRFKKKFYLFDTFEGIDKRFAKKSPINKEEHNKYGLYKFIKKRFKNSHFNIIKGPVPLTLKKFRNLKLSFLHLDMNSSIAEYETLKFFFDKMDYGSVIILDDYGLTSHNQQNIAHNKFFKIKKHMILELPTGQGVCIKGLFKNA